MSRRSRRSLESSRGADQRTARIAALLHHDRFEAARARAREHQSLLGDSLVGLIMRLETAQFVWVVEYCSVAQWQAGRVAARAIVDATASSTDKMPIWLLHDEEVAHVFDRSSAEMRPIPIHLNRTTLGPLPRMELNLTSGHGVTGVHKLRSGETTEPGGDE